MLFKSLFAEFQVPDISLSEFARRYELKKSRSTVAGAAADDDPLRSGEEGVLDLTGQTGVAIDVQEAGAAGEALTLELDENDPATQEALAFVLGDEANDVDKSDGQNIAGSGGTEGGSGGAQGPGSLHQGDPYFGLIRLEDDPNRIYKGKVQMFNQQNGFGFIELLCPEPRPAHVPAGARFPDIYFSREDIVLIGAAKSVYDRQPSLGPEQGPQPAAGGGGGGGGGQGSGKQHHASPLHSMCIGEDVEFCVTLNASRGTDGRKYRAIQITGPQRGPVRCHQPSLRQRGIVRHWNASSQYGFIAPNNNARDVFFHSATIYWSADVPPENRVLEVGFVVEFTAVRQKEKGPQRGGRGGRDQENKFVAVAVTDANFAPIHPATIPRSTNATIRREQERKRRREEDEEVERAQAERRDVTLQLGFTDELDAYGTW